MENPREMECGLRGAPAECVPRICGGHVSGAPDALDVS